MKKVLILSLTPTPPVSSGSQKCILEYCELLKRTGADVYFLYIEGKEKAHEQLKSYWGNRLFIYKRNQIFNIIKRGLIESRKKVTGYNLIDDLYPIGLTNYVKSLQNKYSFDAIIINYVVLSKLFDSRLAAKQILYTHDCLSFKKLRLGMNQFWIDLMPNQEAKGLQRCDMVLSIQENESKYFAYLHPKGDIKTVYSYFKANPQPLTKNKNLLFLSGKSELNLNGINYFIEDIFPLVIEKEPDTQLIIGGRICEMLPRFDNPHIKAIGLVDKEESFYGMGDIAINPIYQGTGLKIKTFEALSYGKVTIVHPHSAEGVYNIQECPILIGNTSENFATHIINALSDINLRQRCSDKAIEYIQSLDLFVEQQYNKILS